LLKLTEVIIYFSKAGKKKKTSNVPWGKRGAAK
jgi:hypothetical protein